MGSSQDLQGTWRQRTIRQGLERLRRLTEEGRGVDHQRGRSQELSATGNQRVAQEVRRSS